MSDNSNKILNTAVFAVNAVLPCKTGKSPENLKKYIFLNFSCGLQRNPCSLVTLPFSE